MRILRLFIYSFVFMLLVIALTVCFPKEEISITPLRVILSGGEVGFSEIEVFSNGVYRMIYAGYDYDDKELWDDRIRRAEIKLSSERVEWIASRMENIISTCEPEDSIYETGGVWVQALINDVWYTCRYDELNFDYIALQELTHYLVEISPIEKMCYEKYKLQF